MKTKVINTAGRAWRTLGEKGEMEISSLSKILNEREDIVNQAIGWLAREDKINYSTKKDKTFVSLVAKELQAFKQQACSSDMCCSSSKTTRKT